MIRQISPPVHAGFEAAGGQERALWTAFVEAGIDAGPTPIAAGRRALRPVLFQAAPAAACRNPVPKPVAQRLKKRGKPHKPVIVAIACRLITSANAILKTGAPWQYQPGAQTQLWGPVRQKWIPVLPEDRREIKNPEPAWRLRHRGAGSRSNLLCGTGL